jgi:ech hydrogenase subunit B
MSNLYFIVLRGIIVIVLAPLAGGLLTGIDRKISAHMQGRKGPPLIQPFYDVIKLFGKQRMAVNKMQDAYVLGFLLFASTALIMLFTSQDILMIVFVLAFGDISLIMGAMSVRSPYSRIGAQREIMQLMAAEPVIILTAVGVYLATGSFLIPNIFKFNLPLLAVMPLQFAALLLVLTIKLRKSPFDFSTSHHGHQELIKGLTIEFSGAQLAIIELAQWFELLLLLGIVALFFIQPIWVGILIALMVFFFEILIDNISARTTWVWMLKVAGLIGLGLSISNIIWLYLRTK